MPEVKTRLNAGIAKKHCLIAKNKNKNKKKKKTNKQTQKTKTKSSVY